MFVDRVLRPLLIGVVALFCGAGLSVAKSPGPSRAVPDSIGIQVQDVSSKVFDRAAQGGFKIVRMDLAWYAVETVKGRYDWREYDGIVARLKARGLRPLFILDFNNPNYSAGAEMDGIDTPAEREGFKNFAVAAVKRYQGAINPLWEIYNEPNRPTFWTRPNAGDYMKLVKVVVPAMRRANPDLFIMAPGLGHNPALDGTDRLIKLDFGYLERAFAMGLLNYVDAVSIHPYPDGRPELALGIYDRVRVLMRKYNTMRPIISSEWGYSSAASFSNTPQGHANFLTRMYLINLSEGVLSIGFKLDARVDPTADLYEREFSWFNANGTAKPVYTQVKAMVQALKGLTFVKRLPSRGNDYLLEFSNGRKTVAAMWTTASPHTVMVSGKAVTLSGKPVYVTK